VKTNKQKKQNKLPLVIQIVVTKLAIVSCDILIRRKNVQHAMNDFCMNRNELRIDFMITNADTMNKYGSRSLFLSKIDYHRMMTRVYRLVDIFLRMTNEIETRSYLLLKQ
jgi:hypothetical protein